MKINKTTTMELSKTIHSKSEIIRAGLRVLEDHEEERTMKMKALRQAVQAGVNSGPGIPMDDVIDELTAKYQAQIDA